MLGSCIFSYEAPTPNPKGNRYVDSVARAVGRGVRVEPDDASAVELRSAIGDTRRSGGDIPQQNPTYRTGLIGKYFNEYVPPYKPPGWDEWIVPKGMYNYTGTSWYVDKGAGGSNKSVPGYQTDTMASFASDFIGRNAPSVEPFFLHLSIVAPHAGNPSDPDDISGFPSPYVKPVYQDRFEGLANTDPSFNEADVSDKPVKPSPLTSAEIRGLNEHNSQRRETELSIDDAVTGIMDALTSSGELDNTYVMFTSDNGLFLRHRIRGGKGRAVRGGQSGALHGARALASHRARSSMMSPPRWTSPPPCSTWRGWPRHRALTESASCSQCRTPAGH